MWPAIALVVGVAVISLAGYFEHRGGQQSNRFGFTDGGPDSAP
ncbi:MAG: hypothetical protein ABIP89_20895 [Polyangiaceae bacterium]